MCSDLRSWPVFGSLEPEFISQIHMVMVFGKTFGNKALIVTKDKTVYILDENLHDCLETGYETSGPYLKEIEDLCGKDIKTFAYGMGPHILALTNGGEVYSCDDVNGQSENGTCNKVLAFTLMNVPTIEDSQNVKHVVDIACGYYHSTILTENGEYDDDNPLVILKAKAKQMEKTRWIDIAALNNSSIAVNEAGRVYVWGDCRGKSILTPTGTSSFNVHDALAHYGPSIMHKPLILDEELDILGCLGIAFDDSSTSDLKIQVEDKCIHVHKAILKIRSLYFRKMFEHDWAENNQSVIKINEFSYVVYEEYLKFLYTNIISLSFEKISELFDLAIAYCENNLKKHCIRRIKQRITISNVAYFYSFAVKYDIEELEEFCVQFAVSHMMAVTRTENFAKLDQNLMKTFIIKASEAGCFRN
ncbi:RCC1 and BTB domain-containing protein 1 [Trachymyrmex zeteki]|uniref:RCC1 and BTB domain-containing protein 1 n=1 Tax=Mycetomoellerius zeteki TaxID=64791 RepID=A0A151XK84_9HYME|nr:RCC1 and BTB domain-containing protein 1 [Trachymyrmex zeteki]